MIAQKGSDTPATLFGEREREQPAGGGTVE